MQVRQIDLAGAQSKFVAWLQKKMPEASDISIMNIERSGSGLSNETFLFEMTWKEDGRPQSRGMVLRLPPKSFPVHPEYDLKKQFTIMQILGKTSVPVPKVYWMEEDAEILGAPFYVMGKLKGVVPPDYPPIIPLESTSMPHHRNERKYGGGVLMPWQMSTSWTGRSSGSPSSGSPKVAPMRWIADLTTWRSF
jgi:hypothetical protein